MSVFDPEIAVPDSLIASSPSKRKKTILGRGVAGSRRACMLAAKGDKVTAESKLPYLHMTGVGSVS